MIHPRRHYGMDWLRVGAFAILILYHVGMVFVPWGFHVKASATIDPATLPMLFVSPWRLGLLFLVSGYASRALLARSAGPGAFLRSRAARLLVPLAFGVAVIVPPQAWVELTTQHGYAGGYLRFWLTDWFRFTMIDGVLVPAWNHLWFVGYLFLYTAALVGLLALPRPAGGQRAFDRIFVGVGVLALPVAWLLLTQVILFQRWTDTHDVIGDGIAHLAYFPMFAFGFALARSERAMAALVRWWLPAALLSLASYGVTAAIELAYPGAAAPPQYLADVMVWVRPVQGWCAIAALVGIATRFLDRDHRWRPMLTEAVFPFYLVHQTIIVVVGGRLLSAELPPAADFAILVAATVAGCWAFYLVGREIGWLRPLIGLRRLPSPGVAASRPAPV